MKIFRYIFMAGVLAISLASCEKDGDFLTVKSGSEVVVDGNVGDIVLRADHLDDLALTVYWSDNGEISLSNPLVAAPKNAYVNTIQFSNSEDFATVTEQAVDDGVFQMQFSVSALNTIVGRLGFVGDVSAPLYIRIKSTLGDNMEPSYSNIMQVNVTPYSIDMTVGVVLDSNQSDTGLRLYSPNANGVYEGFIGASGWYNFYLQEPDGTIWGNDGVTGTPFMLSSENDANKRWNFWFPGVAGCYYTIVDTPKAEWSALLIPALEVSGDITGSMTYDRANNQWSIAYTATSAGQLKVKIAGTGKQYNISTGADDSAVPVDTPVGFSQSGGAIAFGSDAGDITVDIPSAGEMSIVLNLSDPKNFTCTAVAGSVGPVETPRYLYLSGVDDGLNGGSWTFDNYLRLYDEDNLGYGGACNVNSLWGYRIYTEAGNWDSAYTMVDGGTALSGKLQKVADGNTANITAPSAGLYVFDVSMKGLTYNLTAVNSVSYSGLNDDWTGFTPLTATATAGVYETSITISQVSEWGFKIYINDNWDISFGGSNGVLTLYSSGITDDATLGAGTYRLTVDLCKGTYSITD